MSRSPDAEAAIRAAVHELLSKVDSGVLERLIRGEVELAVAERNPLASAIAGLPIEAAYEMLNKQPGVAALKSYFAAPKALTLKAPSVATTKAGLIAAILQDAYGVTYAPPRRAKVVKPRAPRMASVNAKDSEPFNAARILAQLESATSEEEAAATVAAVTGKPNLQAVARLLEIEFKQANTVAWLRDAIVRRGATGRLTHEAYVRLGDR